jgi:hypothetical protein
MKTGYLRIQIWSVTALFNRSDPAIPNTTQYISHEILGGGMFDPASI